MIEFGFAGPDDLAALVGMLLDDEYARSREGDDLEEYQEAFQDITGDPNQFLVVAREGREVVGFLQLTFIQGLSRQGMKRALVESVRVADSHRGQGVGRRMMEWTIEFARSQGCGLVQLTSDARRKRAADFYERLGFVPSHVGMKLIL